MIGNDWLKFNVSLSNQFYAYKIICIVKLEFPLFLQVWLGSERLEGKHTAEGDKIRLLS
jgi:hypothetical protein